MKLRKFILLFFVCLFVTACSDDVEEGRKITDYKELELTVASQKVPGVLWSDGNNYLTDVYAVKVGSSGDWSAFGPINGFDFTDGFEHRIKISETTYLDYNMGQPSWPERELLEVISKVKKESKDLPPHFIPEWYYKERSIDYKYAIEADDKAVVEKDIKDNSIFPIESHCLFYGAGSSWKWIIIDGSSKQCEKGIIKTKGKEPEEMPETYKLLPPDGNTMGFGEFTFLDETGNATVYASFDAFFGYAPKSRDFNRSPELVYLYKDLTAEYQNKYPEANVKAVVIRYKMEL